MTAVSLTAVPFDIAAGEWLETRKHHISPRTYIDYRNHIKTLKVSFGPLRLPEITGDLVRDYQKMRMARAGPSLINRECSVLCQMRDRIGMPLEDYQRLRMPKDWQSPGRRLTTEEERKLENVFREAADVPKWCVGALTSMLSMKSGVGPGEMRFLQLKHCSLNPPQIMIPPLGAKNVRRERPVPLNGQAAWALQRLVDRAIDVCKCSDEEHYLIPYLRKNKTFDVTRPCSEDGWRTALKHLLGMSGIENFRPYDFRHHAVSVALGNRNVTLEDAKLYFGWISGKMVRRYYHTNLAKLRTVAAAMETPARIEEFDPRKKLESVFQRKKAV